MPVVVLFVPHQHLCLHCKLMRLARRSGVCYTLESHSFVGVQATACRSEQPYLQDGNAEDVSGDDERCRYGPQGGSAVKVGCMSAGGPVYKAAGLVLGCQAALVRPTDGTQQPPG